MTPLEQALIAAARAFIEDYEKYVQSEMKELSPQTQQEQEQPAAQAAQPQTQATQSTTQAAQQQSAVASALTLEALSTELRNLETQTQGRLFSQIAPLLIKYVGAIPGPGGSQMPAGGVQQLPPDAYGPFLQEAQALAAQLMQQGSTVQ